MKTNNSETITKEQLLESISKLNKITPPKYEDMYYVCIYCHRVYKGFPRDWIVLCDECKKKLNWNS